MDNLNQKILQQRYKSEEKYQIFHVEQCIVDSLIQKEASTHVVQTNTEN